MKVLIACECSQVECFAFRREGFEAYSCDVQPSYGSHPEWHILGDCFDALESESWDLVIAHPPCTYLTIAQSNLIFDSAGQVKNFPRWRKSLRAARFFLRFLDWHSKTKVPIAIENPKIFHRRVGIPSPDFMISPNQFGEPWYKPLNFWVRGLPVLLPDSCCVVNPRSWHYHSGCVADWRDSRLMSNVRSKSFEGVARAMARQWGNFVSEKK